jgi:predicted transcriptional regulator
MDSETIITLTADIASAHVSNNSLSAADVPTLIQTVYDALSGVLAPKAPVEEKREPAVSIRSSVKADAIACLECGVKLKMLKRHLSTDHALSPAEYRARWGLHSDYPLVAPDYAAKRKELALKIGLGRKPKSETKPAPKKRGPRKPKAPADTPE